MAIVCASSASYVAKMLLQYCNTMVYYKDKTYRTPGVAASRAAAVKRRKYTGRIVPFAVEAGGRLGAEARELISKVVEHCDISERAEKAATFKIIRAVWVLS